MQNENAVANVATEIAERLIIRRERDAKLADSARSRVAGYNAYFATAAFAELAIEQNLDLAVIFDAEDKQLDRLTKFMTAIKTGEFFMRDENDQNRYCYNLLRTAVNAHNQKIALVTRSDATAAASKTGSVQSEYVSIANKLVSDATAVRQMSQIAAPVLAMLNVIEVQRVGNKVIGYKAKPKSPLYRKLAAMVKAEQAAQNH